MLDLTEAQKKIFCSGTYFHGYQMHFPDLGLTIGNDTIHSEAVTIKESICDEEELVLGGCIASSCEFEVSEILQNELNGQGFIAIQETVDEDGDTAIQLPMGYYQVDSAELVDDKDYKKVVAYDALYGASVDVSEWYNALFPAEEKSVTKLQDGKEVTVKVVEYGTVKLKAMRESLLQHLGIPFRPQSLINDDMDVEKTIAPTAGSLTGTTALKAICTVNAGFGRMDRSGSFEVIYLPDMHSIGLYPHAGLYPHVGLYPTNSGGAQDMTKLSGASDTEAEYRSIRCEEYTTDKITCLNIQTDEEDVGVTVGTDLSDPYLITGNFLLYGKSEDELKVIGGNILSKLKGIYYRPVSELKLNALPYLETGDMIVAEKEAEKVYSYIFSRTLSGIQAQIDTYEAKGNQKRQNEVTQESELMQLKGRTLKIQKNIDSVYIEMANVEKQTSTRYEQTDEAIRLEAKRATDAEKELQSSIELQADRVVLKVDSAGRLVEVALGVDPDTAKTYFKAGADNIDLEAEDVFNIISGNALNLSGKKITIASDKFNVDEDGTVKAESIDISGGSIHLETQKSPESLVRLANYDITAEINGAALKFRYAGEGAPKDSSIPNGTVEVAPPQIGECYFDLSTAEVYQFKYGNGAHWVKVTEDLDNPAEVTWTISEMSTGGGFSTTEYKIVYLDVEDGKGGTTRQAFREGNSVEVTQGGVNFAKNTYTTRNGTAQQQDMSTHIELTADEYDEQLQPVPVVKMDAPVKVQGDYAYRGDFAVLGDVASSGTLSGNALVINGSRLLCGSFVRDFTAIPLPSTGIITIATPDIDTTMPATICNGDADANPGLAFGSTRICPAAACIEAQVTSTPSGMARINYSYWQKL